MSSSVQILNSAPLTELSPTEAIKSTLIPSLRYNSGGGGSHEPQTHYLATQSLALGAARWNLTGVELPEPLSLRL